MMQVEWGFVEILYLQRKITGNHPMRGIEPIINLLIQRSLYYILHVSWFPQKEMN